MLMQVILCGMKVETIRIGESKLAGKSFFDTDNDFKINNFFDFCTRYLKKEPKEKRTSTCNDSILCI